MPVTVILASGSSELVVVQNSPTLTADPDGGLKVTYLSSEAATITVRHFIRGEWQEAWYQPNSTAEREQHVTASN